MKNKRKENGNIANGYVICMSMNMRIKCRLDRLFMNIKNRLLFNELMNDNRGMGVVEIILIILVLVGLVVIFRTKITSIVNTIFSKLISNVNTF